MVLLNIINQITIEKIKEIWKDSFFFEYFYHFWDYWFRKNHKNDNFTILCSNCIGGCIYHRLGKRFLSPTVNLMFSPFDFVYFCRYLSHYLSQKLTFIESSENYPIAILKGIPEEAPDIKIDFVHYKTETEAAEKWYERSKRINYDNLYIIFTGAGFTDEHFRMMEAVQCNNKVLLSSIKEADISWAHTIKSTQKHGYNYLFFNALGLRYYERKWNFVEFLNTKPGTVCTRQD